MKRDILGIAEPLYLARRVRGMHFSARGPDVRMQMAERPRASAQREEILYIGQRRSSASREMYYHRDTGDRGLNGILVSRSTRLRPGRPCFFLLPLARSPLCLPQTRSLLHSPSPLRFNDNLRKESTVRQERVSADRRIRDQHRPSVRSKYETPGEPATAGGGGGGNRGKLEREL